MVMTAATVLGDKLTLQKLPFLTPEEVQERLSEMDEESIDRMQFAAHGASDGSQSEDGEEA